MGKLSCNRYNMATLRCQRLKHEISSRTKHSKRLKGLEKPLREYLLEGQSTIFPRSVVVVLLVNHYVTSNVIGYISTN